MIATSFNTGNSTQARARICLHWKEMFRLAAGSLASARIRFTLTTLGMVIGTASVIVVVTVGLAGKQFILRAIQKIGTNEIELEYAGTGEAAAGANRNGYLTIADERAVDSQFPNVLYSSSVLEMRDPVSASDGLVKNTLVLGVSPEYRFIRNLLLPYGRFFDEIDAGQNTKCAVITDKFAHLRFGNPRSALGQQLMIGGVPFTIIGVFDQSVTDFGESEISGETILIPYSVARYFTDSDEVKQIYFSMHNMAEVPAGADTIRRIVSARHNPKFIYATQDLDHVMHLAAKISNIVTIILILIAAVTLIVGGVGIMNIMLANVGDRVDEIGLRKALGATQREIKMQFISEAVFISLSGGLVGCVLGLALPLSVRWFSGLELPVSLWSVVIGLAAACLTGVVFGTVPAARAAELDPVESMRYEL